MGRVDYFREALARLNRIGIALTGERDLKRLLALILQEARHFTGAEAGSLYVMESRGLRFAVSQNDALASRGGRQDWASAYQDQLLPLTTGSMAGYVALTGNIINLDDAYQVPDTCAYRFNPEFDLQNQYCTRSMLVVPMREPRGNIIGVLQLINAKDAKGDIIPFDPSLEDLVMSLASQAAVALRNVRLTEQLKDAYFDTIFRLSVAAEFKDESTADHLHRMAHYSAMTAEALGFDLERVEMVRYAAPMHDIGKIGIADLILRKTGKLTEAEYERMMEHTIIGHRILAGSDAPILQLSATIALTHHEKYDGSGYPQGLRGEQIPLEGRIVALADVFDAVASSRCYKPALPLDDCLRIVRQERGRHFDPQVVDAFLGRLDEVLKVRDQYSGDTRPSRPHPKPITLSP